MFCIVFCIVRGCYEPATPFLHSSAGRLRRPASIALPVSQSRLHTAHPASPCSLYLAFSRIHASLSRPASRGFFRPAPTSGVSILAVPPLRSSPFLSRIGRLRLPRSSGTQAFRRGRTAKKSYRLFADKIFLKDYDVVSLRIKHSKGRKTVRRRLTESGTLSNSHFILLENRHERSIDWLRQAIQLQASVLHLWSNPASPDGGRPTKPDESYFQRQEEASVCDRVNYA